MPSIDLRSYATAPSPSPKSAGEPGKLSVFLNKDISFGKPQLSDKKKEAFYLELHSLLEAGINLKDSLELIAAEQKGEKDQKLLNDIQEMVMKGDALSAALQKTSLFSIYEVYTLQIGEETGKLTDVLDNLVKFYQSKIKQRRKIISSLTYPCVVMSTSLGAVLFMLKFVVPMFGDVFKRFGGQLPWITQKILDISGVMESGFPYFIGFLVLSAIVISRIRHKESYRRAVSNIVLRIPVAGGLVQKIYLARFCNAMQLLIDARLPLLRAIALNRQMISYYPVESSLQAVEQGILKGLPLHQSMQPFKIYPRKMIQLIKVGEETNRLDYFFRRIAEQYIEEVEYKTATLSTVMEPLIIVFLGLIVGVILISMYLPLFQMSSNIQ